jgi:hypothetical protein
MNNQLAAPQEATQGEKTPAFISHDLNSALRAISANVRKGHLSAKPKAVLIHDALGHEIPESYTVDEGIVFQSDKDKNAEEITRVSHYAHGKLCRVVTTFVVIRHL